MAHQVADGAEGPAVLGDTEVVCWTPCHRRTVRIDRVLLCTRPFTTACSRCGAIWLVRFRREGRGVGLIAEWTYGPCDRF